MGVISLNSLCNCFRSFNHICRSKKLKLNAKTKGVGDFLCHLFFFLIVLETQGRIDLTAIGINQFDLLIEFFHAHTILTSQISKDRSIHKAVIELKIGNNPIYVKLKRLNKMNKMKFFW